MLFGLNISEEGSCALRTSGLHRDCELSGLALDRFHLSSMSCFFLLLSCVLGVLSCENGEQADPNSSAVTTPNAGLSLEVEPEEGTLGPGLLVLDSLPEYDPLGAELFIVSLEFVLGKDVPVGPRNRLIMKYLGKEPPYPGWSLALRRTQTSLRPELYWQDTAGAGGWFSFAEVSLEPNRRYALSLAVMGFYAAMFIEELDSTPRGPGFDVGEQGSLSREKDSLGRVKFMGGYALNQIKPPATGGKLQCLKETPGGAAFSARMKEAVIVRLDKQVQTQVELKKLLLGGPKRLGMKVLPENIVSVLTGGMPGRKADQ